MSSITSAQFTRTLNNWFVVETSARAIKSHIHYMQIAGVEPTIQFTQLYEELRQNATILQEHIIELMAQGALR